MGCLPIECIDNLGGDGVPSPPDPWVYTQRPGQSQFPGGTANGGILYMAPEAQLQDYRNGALGKSRSVLSLVYLIAGPNVYYGAGRPETVTGGMRAGFSWGSEEFSDDLLFLRHRDRSPAYAGPFRQFRLMQNGDIGWYEYDPDQDSQVWGLHLGELRHQNSADRVWAWPDVSGTVLLGPPEAPVFLQGSIPFAVGDGTLSEDNDNLYWDDVLDRLGVKLAGSGPTATVHIGASTTSQASVRLNSGTAPSSPNEGDLWNDSTRKALQTYLDGVKQTLQGVLFTSTATGTVSGTATETTVVGGGVGTLTLPANFFVAGKTIRLKASGVYGTTVPAGTLNLRAKLGSTVICATGDQTAGNSLTNRQWHVEAIITCRTAGAGGTVFGQGTFPHHRDAVTSDIWEMSNTTTVSVNTTGSLAVDLTADWGTSHASNTISCTDFTLEILN